MMHVVELDPANNQAVFFYGQYLSLDGEYEEAIGVLSPMKDDFVDNPLYHHYLGYDHAGQGKRPESLAEYDISFRLISRQSSSKSKLDLYRRIVKDLVLLGETEPEVSIIIDDIWLMLRGAMAADNDIETSLDQLRNSSSLLAGFYYRELVPKNSGNGLVATQSFNGELPITATLQHLLTTTVDSPQNPTISSSIITKTFWVYLGVAGPERIKPGDSDIILVVAELRESLDTEGLALPVELVVGHEYEVAMLIDTVNFELSQNNQLASQLLELGRPVQWQWVISPKAGYEGNQHIIYTVMLRDLNDTSWVKTIPAKSIIISVPTRYGIPSQILYPLSGLGAFLGAFLTFPFWKTLFDAWKERRKRDENRPKIVISKK